MVEQIRNYSTDFLDGKIDCDKFIMKCKELYSLAISDYTKSIQLDNIIVIPFIHEFAYCEYKDSELKSQVLNFLSILNGTKSYCYSTFLKLLPPDKNQKEEFDLYCKFNGIKIKDLYSVFNHYIEKPLTIKDILNNSIFDILDALDLENTDESCFNYINCNENIRFSQIEERILLLLSYYLGINTLFVQVSLFACNNTVYTIM